MDATHLGTFDAVLDVLNRIEALVRRGMSADLIVANVGLPPEVTMRLIEAVQDCEQQPKSCRFTVVPTMAWSFAEYFEDPKPAMPAVEALRHAYREAQSRYLDAYARPGSGAPRDIAGHDEELVFQLARTERELCPQLK